MASAYVTLTRLKHGALGNGQGHFALYSWTCDGGDYNEGGIFTENVTAWDGAELLRMPDCTFMVANNGYLYHFGVEDVPIVQGFMIRAQDAAAAEDQPLGELQSGVAVPLAARSGVLFLAFWFNRVP